MPKPVGVQQAGGEYEKIAMSLRDDIRTGRLKPGDQTAYRRGTVVAHTVAVGTAHRALALLKEEPPYRGHSWTPRHCRG